MNLVQPGINNEKTGLSFHVYVGTCRYRYLEMTRTVYEIWNRAYLMELVWCFFLACIKVNANINYSNRKIHSIHTQSTQLLIKLASN